jgi:hypothetical protein
VRFFGLDLPGGERILSCSLLNFTCENGDHMFTELTLKLWMVVENIGTVEIVCYIQYLWVLAVLYCMYSVNT